MTRDISLLFFLYIENELHQHVLKHVTRLEEAQAEDARAEKALGSLPDF